MSKQLNPMSRNIINTINRINARLKRWEKRFGKDSSVYNEAQSIIRTYFEQEIYHDAEVQGKATYITGDGTHFLSRGKDISLTDSQLAQLERLDKLTDKNMISNLMKLANRAVPDANYQDKMKWIREREYVVNYLNHHLEENYGTHHEWEGDEDLYEFLKKSRVEKAETGYEEVYKLLRRNKK